MGALLPRPNLKKVSCGTELSIVQEGLPAAIPSEACYLGWQESLILLAKPVEAEFQTSSSVVGPKSGDSTSSCPNGVGNRLPLRTRATAEIIHDTLQHG